jgi:hypothetical protein
LVKSNSTSEASHQEGFLNWFHQKFPGVLIYHCPNGEHRSISTGIRLKKLGVIRGIPDLFIPSWKIYLELKRENGGIISPEQKKVMEYLTRVGYTCMVCHGATDASIQVLNFLKEKQ